MGQLLEYCALVNLQPVLVVGVFSSQSLKIVVECTIHVKLLNWQLLPAPAPELLLKRRRSSFLIIVAVLGSLPEAGRSRTISAGARARRCYPDNSEDGQEHYLSAIAGCSIRWREGECIMEFNP
jgi:hypothetical protein